MQFPQYPTAKNYNKIPSGYPVCTVVRCFPDGALIPLWFGIEINEERFRYEIKAIKSIKEVQGIHIFECCYEDFGMLRVALLRFDVNNHLWTIG